MRDPMTGFFPHRTTLSGRSPSLIDNPFFCGKLKNRLLGGEMDQHVFIDTLKQQFAKEGPSISIVLLTNRTVVDWLRSHIRKLDRDLGAFLKNRDCWYPCLIASSARHRPRLP
jgi:hypothetical protein